jgi:hypothetical protein
MKKTQIAITAIGIIILVFGFLAFYFNREDTPTKEIFTGKISEQVPPNKINNTIVHPELGVIQLPTPTPPDAINKLVPETENNYKNELTDDMKIALLEDIKSNKLIYDANTSAGFSDHGTSVMANNDPFSLMSINDLPTELQEVLRKELEEYEKYGYDLISDKGADEIVRINEYVYKDPDTISSSVDFALSELPESLTDNYEYVGHAFPGAIISQSEDEPHDTIRRVYKSTDSSDHLIIVEETSSESGDTATALTKEFVNTDVNEYPAIYSKKKTESGKTYAMLTWTTQTSAYSVYQVGSVDEKTAGKIGSMAGEISDANVGK